VPPPSDADPTGDPGAALVVRALRHLRHVGDPERHLSHETDRVPRTKPSWIRRVLLALRASRAVVILSAEGGEFNVDRQQESWRNG
jgi:hypothetical protein